jgi:hypothetical protein
MVESRTADAFVAVAPPMPQAPATEMVKSKTTDAFVANAVQNSAVASQRKLRAEEMQTVGLQRSRGTFRPQETRYYLANRIHHVWLMDSPEQGRKFIDDLAADGKLQVEWDDRSGTATLNARLIVDDRELQQIVDGMADRQWALLSPSLPQPGKAEKVQFLGKELVYDVSLVQKEGDK